MSSIGKGNTMTGSELSEQFYNAFGKPMLEKDFPELLPFIACAFTGSGSECLGFDDETSRDHDFEPGFTIFLPGEDLVTRRQEFLLERAYEKLPREFSGFRRSVLSPVGGNRFGVRRMADFFTEKTGFPDGILTVEAWLRIDTQYLLEATNGKVFHDGLFAFSEIRERLKWFPEDILLKRMAGLVYGLGQARYHYERCLLHGETGAGQLFLADYVEKLLKTAHLLENKYAPYRKWLFRSAKNGLFADSELWDAETLISTDNTPENAENKRQKMDGLEQVLLTALVADGFLKNPTDLGHAAYELNDRIGDADIRNLSILYAE